MTLTNGDASGGLVPLLRGQPPLDYTKALEILEMEYPEKDGLDVYTLLDSTKNGALTYNDFLIMPGYIGTDARLDLIKHPI
jgi:IMP dehydrogenase